MDVRVAPAPLRELGPLARMVAWLAGRATIGEPANVFTTLGRHRRLFRSWIPFAGSMLLRTRLSRADVELVVLRTAFNCTSAYEWAQHVPLARKAGLSAATVTAVSHGGEHEGLSGRQLLLLTATDDLHSLKVVRAATWRELSSMLDEREVIELCMLVGHYEMLAMTLNSLGVQPERSAIAGLETSTAETASHLQASLDAAAT